MCNYNGYGYTRLIHQWIGQRKKSIFFIGHSYIALHKQLSDKERIT